MPLYEGIGLISEKHSVVLDIGTVYTKCGFAGEPGPRCIIPTEIKCSKTHQMMKLVECHTSGKLCQFLIDFIHHLYFKHLLVNPKDRRVVIVESVLTPTLIRDTLAKVMFIHFEISSVVFVPSHLMSLFTLGISSGLILDAGFNETQIFPVYEGILLLNSGETIPLAAKAIHRSLEKLLLDHSVLHFHERQVPLVEMQDSLPHTILEDITVRACFVTTSERGNLILQDKATQAPPDVDYAIDGDKILCIPGIVREQASEILFQLDNDMQSIATTILDVILKSPVDLRRTLAENIVIMGGTAMMPGFKARLKSELHSLISCAHYCNRLAIKTFKFHHPPAKENYIAWLGAAIFGATDVLTSRSLTKEQYMKHRCTPDWANLQFALNRDEEKTL